MASGLLLLFLALAEPPPTSVADDITIVGTRETPDDTRRQAQAYVRQMGVAAGETPAARWVDPICPRAIGVAPAIAAQVAARVRAIAAAHDVPVARPRCRTNIVISFTADASGLVQRIARRSSRPLAQVPVTDRDALLGGTAPVRWWYETGVRGRDGIPASDIPPPMAGTNGFGGPILANGDQNSFVQHYTSSLISTQAVRAITGATVVVDVERASGISLDAVAAYAALVALAEVRVRDPAPRGSILALFEGRGGRDLTAQDSAFLSGLYDLPLDRHARQHRSRLVRALIMEQEPD